ncbi:MAG TPA: hypothetical protein VEL82_05275 [Thermoplasmata archaeon]|nr:hypothetical protein [Thermoplasmata archaeon]
MQLLEPLGSLERGDRQLLEYLDLVVGLLEQGLAGLATLLERLGLLLEDPGESGRRDAAPSATSRRGPPP